MKKVMYFFVLSMFLMLANSASAIKIFKNDIHLLSSGKGAEIYHYVVNKNSLGNVPSWNGKGTPPLTHSKLIDLVLDEHKKLNGDVKSHIKKISLSSKSTNCMKSQKCPKLLWHYKVKVRGEKRATYIVLLNGDFVKPVAD